MTANPRFATPIHVQDTLLELREHQIRDRTIILQTINMRRLQRQYAATHNHLDLIQMRRAQEILDDLLEPLTAIWPDVLPDLITGEGGSW